MKRRAECVDNEDAVTADEVAEFQTWVAQFTGADFRLRQEAEKKVKSFTESSESLVFSRPN